MALRKTTAVLQTARVNIQSGKSRRLMAAVTDACAQLGFKTTRTGRDRSNRVIDLAVKRIGSCCTGNALDASGFEALAHIDKALNPVKAKK